MTGRPKVQKLASEPRIGRGWLRSVQHGRLFGIIRGNGLLLLANLLTGVIASRALGPSLRGEFAATITWCTAISVVLTLGVTQAVVVHKATVEWLRPWILAQVAFGAVMGLLMCIVLRLSGAQDWLGVKGAVGGGLFAAGAVASSLSSGWLQRHGRMGRDFQLSRLAPQAFLVASMLGLWVAGARQSGTWILVVGAFSGACAILILLANLHKTDSATQLAPFAGGEDEASDRRAFLRLAAGSLIVAVGAQVIYRLDAVVVAVVMEPRQVGLYAVALGAGGVAYSLGTAAGMLMFADLRLAKTRVEQRKLILHAVRTAALISGLICVPAVIFASPLVEIIYGTSFKPAVAATRILLCASVALAVDYVLVHAVLALNAKRFLVAVQTLAGSLTLALLLFATQSDDIALVAWVSMAVYPLSASMHLAVVLAKTRNEPSWSGNS